MARRMWRRTLVPGFVCAILLGLVLSQLPRDNTDVFAAPAHLPSGFKVELYASGLPTPRFLSFSPEGDLYVANMQSGRVAVLPDRNHDNKPDDVIAFAGGFVQPNNVVFRNGSAYVGETSRIWRHTDTNGDLVADTRLVVIDNLPADGRHKTQTIG